MKLIEIWKADIERAYELQCSFLKNEQGFINSAYGYSFDEFEKYVYECKDNSMGIGLPKGYVPATVFILEDDEGRYVGIFNLRHYLNEALANGAGHIGYGMSFSYRNRGYATKGLELVLQEAKSRGITEVYLSVNKNNLPSLKVQQHNGAIIHHEDENKYYTRIKL